jgi:N,N'-diacetyllegionaminate synthase
VPVLVIAEAGMNHDGSLGNAKRLAEAASACGADAVKFQLHDAEAETTRDAPSPPYFGSESRWDYFLRTAFVDEEWRALKDTCDRAGIEFLCSAFSVEALERLEAFGVARHKIPSGEVTNLELVRLAAQTRKPLLLSSGMSSWAELDEAVAVATEVDGDVTVMQCTSEYPCPPERVGLNVLAEARERYGLPVGLSDHTLGPHAAFAAVALGATVIEKHFTLSREMYGPDAALAAEPGELRQLVEGIRAIESMLASPVDKSDVSTLAEMKRVFEKSVVASTAIPAGTVIERQMLKPKKPGTGIPARRLGEIVGLRAAVDIAPDQVLGEDDVEWPERVS